MTVNESRVLRRGESNDALPEIAANLKGFSSMLVLTRKSSQEIKLGDDITITVLWTGSGTVKLGIEAPPEVRIARDDCRVKEPRRPTPFGLLCEVCE